MKKTMKAAVVREFGQPLVFEDVPAPDPGPGEVLVRIVASGVCHTDLHAADGDWPVKPTLPFIPGHEGAGIVAGLGSGVTGLIGPARRVLSCRGLECFEAGATRVARWGSIDFCALTDLGKERAMSSYAERIVEHLRDAEEALAQDVEAQQRRWQYRVRQGRHWFDKERRQAQRRLKQSIPAYLRGANIWSILTAPVIYSLIVPFAVLDVWVTLYQWICFPIYGIPCVRRREYCALDRHKLAYLNGIEKTNCVF